MRTVKVLGKVLAFAACLSLAEAQAEVALPAGYVELEWIQSTGSEFIDTGYCPLASTPFVAETEGQFMAHVTIYQQMGALPKDGAARFDWGISGSNYKRRWTFSSAEGADQSADLLGHRFVANYGTGVFTIDETTVLTAPPATKDSNRNFFLFARMAEYAGKTDCLCQFRLRSCRLSQNGVAIRDFVPCRTLQGVAGLWDKVEGVFYPNVSGTGAFRGSDEDEAVLLNYLQSSGAQYINTGYKPLGSSAFTFEVDGCFTAFGANYQQMGALPLDTLARYDWGISGTKDGKKWTFGAGASAANSADLAEHRFAGNYETGVFTIDGNTVLTIARAENDSSRDYLLFSRMAEWAGKPDCASQFRLRGCRLGQGGVLVRDFVPMRAANGALGLYDKVNDIHYVNAGSGVFAYGFSYVTNETTLLVREGTLVADENFLGYDAVEKVSGFQLNAAACLSYPGDLTLSQGLFSQQDGEARAYTVVGKLAFSGGAAWAVDWVGTTCDSFSAAELDLSQVTAERPVVVVVDTRGALLDPMHPVVLLASGAVAGDEAKFMSSGVSAEFMVRDGQLLMRFTDATIPMRAVWTGHGARGAMSDTQNWNCYNCFGELLPNVLPTEMTEVTIPNLLAGSFEWLPGETLAYREFIFPASTTLTQDCDWRGMVNLDMLAANTTVNLKGHKLYLAPSGATSRPVTFEDTLTLGGELHYVVDAGQSADNRSFALHGTLAMIKEGAGTLTVTCANGETTAYTGGTVIEAGTIMAGTNIGASRLFGCWGGMTFTARPGTVFDLNGYPDLNRYMTQFSGATLKNSRADISDAWGAYGYFAPLTTNATIDIAFTTTVHGSENHVFELNGHTLFISIGKNKLYNSNGYDYTNGTVVVRSGGAFRSYNKNVTGVPDYSDSRTTDFDFNCGLVLDRDFWVRNLTMRYTGAEGGGACQLKIFGIYTPESDYINNFQLADGATLNLGEKTESWDITGKTLSFAEGATVTLDLGARKKRTGDQLLTWTETERPTNVIFKLANNTENYRFRATNDGLFLDRRFLIVIR